ncbi:MULTISPECIES: hypothetical protein [unclassified Agrococcus]|uniref:hypothetical protein n=1 Tax=unclassified Agrococcus TaxID=2615065 RepID=UPI0036067B2F
MSTLTQPMVLAVARPTTRARRALLALAEALARIALHRPDARAAALRHEAEARRERDADRMLALSPPLR